MGSADIIKIPGDGGSSGSGGRKRRRRRRRRKEGRALMNRLR